MELGCKWSLHKCKHAKNDLNSSPCIQLTSQKFDLLINLHSSGT